MKYIKDDEVYRIDGEIQRSGKHEIHYYDTRYFVDTPKGGKLFAAKDLLMKVTKTAKLTQKKVSFLSLKPHFRSDTESSKEERDDGDMETTYPSSHFHKRNKHFGSDDSDGDRVSLPQIKNVDDDAVSSGRRFPSCYEGAGRSLQSS